MENEIEFQERENKQCHYDKRLILKVVKLVEEGMSRKEVNRLYNLGASTLDGWMQKYGSPAYQERKRKIIPPLLKSKIIADVEQGRLTEIEAQKKYNLTIKTIRTWVNKNRQEFSIFCLPTKQEMAKNNRKASENNDTQSLQKALEEANLKIKALNTMIDIAEEQLKIDIRKKSGTKQSK